MRNINYLTLLVFFFISCYKEPVKSIPYFKFDKTADEWLTEIKLNDTIHFRNQYGNTRKYKVIEIATEKRKVRDCSWLTSNCISYYEYDRHVILFQRIDSIPQLPDLPISFTVGKHMQIPQNIDYTNLPSNTKAYASVHGTFEGYNRLPSPPSTSSYIVFPDLYSPIQLITFSTSSRFYTEVLRLSSDNNSPYVNPITRVVGTINEIGFDKKYGFVYFSDIYGTVWERTN